MRVLVCLLALVLLAGCGVATPATGVPTPTQALIYLPSVTPTRPTPVPPLTATTAPRATPVPPSWPQIVEQHTRLTSAQWETYVTGLKGTRYVDQAGTVVNVQQPIAPLGYDVYVTAPGTDAVRYAFVLDIPAADATKFNRGQAIRFAGTVRGVSCLVWCSVQLEDTTITTP